MNKETFLYLDGHTEYHEVDDNAVYHHVTDDNRLNYRLDVNDATFEWHNNIWMQINIYCIYRIYCLYMFVYVCVCLCSLQNFYDIEKRSVASF